MMSDKLYGGIEAGGTKFVCAVGSSPVNIISQTQIPTLSPEETLAKVIAFFKEQPSVQTIGIASFGPIDLNRQSKTHGFITTTPKNGWQQVDIVGTVKKEFDVPIGFNTDVNGAALGELLYGAAKGLDSMEQARQQIDEAEAAIKALLERLGF